MAAAVWAILGIVASIVIALAFYFLGKRDSRQQNRELLRELNEIRTSFSAFHANVASVMSQTTSVSSDARISTVESPASRPRAIASVGDPAMQELVLAWLGALLDARGHVDLARLYREVGRVLGQADISGVADELRSLRRRGAIEWDGSDDLTGVTFVRMRSSLGGPPEGDASEQAIAESESHLA